MMTNIYEFDSKRLKQKLCTAINEDNLAEVLISCWAQYVPSIFSVQMTPNVQKEESKAAKILFSPLEQFVCDGNPDEVFNKLKLAENPPDICGRVFRSGEPTYSCRECAVDPTCVLCAECFRNSEHKKHKYRMSTSGGGGYCDCGDREAWKTEPSCDVHKKGCASADIKNSINNLPSVMQQRTLKLFKVILQYTFEILLWSNTGKLPDNLQLESFTDGSSANYLTMLFNDEIHTYDQVISCLKKAIRCSEQEAVEFATTVDREGRCIVKIGSQEECEEVKAIIERPLNVVSRHYVKPLKVLVMIPALVSHQTFACKLISWVQHLIGRSDGLRQLFCDLLLADDPMLGKSWVEHIMLLDTQLWKSVRHLTHQLIMSVIMLNPESKKEFAIKFTKLYWTLAADFVKDDHHHEVSIMSESVQIYTVTTLQYPELLAAFVIDSHHRSDSVCQASLQLFSVFSLARILIAEHNLIEVIINAFLELCNVQLNQGKFKFDRPDRHSASQRSQYILNDLKYALVTKPTEKDWTAALHQNFLKGYKSLLKLLFHMQGMDAVVRQVTQHVEFEPEWESAFNLQLKLADVLMLMAEWCGSDAAVLTEAYVITIEELCKTSRQFVREELTVAGHMAPCVKCDNLTQPISIHLPVTRMLAALYPYLNLHNQPIRALHDSSRVRIEEILDPVLNVMVLVAQTQAGMWRRNGYSLISQVYFYHNVKCRAEMFDKDIIMLQASAALMDPNQLVIHLLYKFGLGNWAEEEYGRAITPVDDIVRQITVLVEEFLTLLIHIISERYQQGIGVVDEYAAIKHEVIHQLCIQSLTRSELSKNLNSERYETFIDTVIRDVAVLRKPTESTGKVIFELKEELYNDYNPYFYHYTRTEQSKSEEQQRKRKKQSGRGQALPPPVPPPFIAGFETVTRLLDCDVMIYLQKLIVKRALSKRARAWSEAQFDRCLHLIGLALHEEKRVIQSGILNNFNFFAKSTAEPSLLSMLESLTGSPNITHEAQKDLLTWIIKQFNEVRQLRGMSSPHELKTASVMLSEEKASKEKKRKTKEQAEKRRSRIMAQMAKMQREFMQQNATLFNSVSSEISLSNSEMDIEPVTSESLAYPVCVGSEKSACSLPSTTVQTCILCQEEQEVTVEGRALVYAAFIQKSTVLSKRRGCHPVDLKTYNPLFKSHDHLLGTYTSSCGHVMHADCWQGYFDALSARDRRRGILHFHGQRSYDIEHHEFLCPLCETLSNSVIPLVPSLNSLVKDGEQQVGVEISLNDWLDALQKTIVNSLPSQESDEIKEMSFNPCPLPFVTQMLADSVARNFQMLFDYVTNETGSGFSDSVREMLKKFTKDIYSFGLGVEFEELNERVPIMTWESCAYTFTVIEQTLREESKSIFHTLPLRQTECLRALVKAAALSGITVNCDIVKKHCVSLLSALLCEDLEQRCVSPNFLDLDLFHYMVCVCLSLPTLYSDNSSSLCVPTGGLSDQHLLELVYTAHLVQVILVLGDSEEMNDDDDGPMMSMDVENDDLKLLSAVVSRIRSYAGQIFRVSDIVTLLSQLLMSPPHWFGIQHYLAAIKSFFVEWSLLLSCYASKLNLPSLKNYSSSHLHSVLSQSTLPFLRKSALFFHYLTGIAPPDHLITEMPQNEYELLCRYLALPLSFDMCLGNILDTSMTSSGKGLLVENPILARLVHSWCRMITLKPSSDQTKCLSVSSLQQINHLISMPVDYADLVHEAALFPCPNSATRDESRAPAMCLICGKVLCSQSYCCQSRVDDVVMGAAMRHISSCGISCGIFLRIRDCQLTLLVPPNKGCFYAPPYVDEYGETDQGLRRGNPLVLSAVHYRRLQRLWMSHSIQEEVAHHLEANASLFGVDWQTL